MLSCVCLVLATAATTAGQTPRNLDVADRLATAKRIYELVQQYFAHWDGASRAEVERAYREYVADVSPGGTRTAFGLATLRFIAALHNGHTGFIDTGMDSRPLKFRLLDVEGQWAVIGSRESRLPRGAIVRTIDGRPVEDFVRDAARYVAASNDRLARTHVFSYPALFPERVSIGLQDGTVVEIDRSKPGDAPPPLATGVEGRWIQEGRVACLRIPSFADPGNERTAIDTLRQFSSAPRLIVDVRGNGGGTTPGRLIRALMNRPWRFWQASPPRDNPEQSPSPDAYQGAVWVLVDRFCGSACEDFVMPFKTTGRGILVGETTQGSSGNPYRADLGGGMSVSIGAIRYRFPDGTAFEGVGIAPDIAVERRLADIAAGRDAVMARALELAGVTK